MKFRFQPRSIAFRLIVAVLAVELLSAILVVVLSFGYERHIHFRAFDVMLHGRADSILGAVQDADDPGDNVMLDQADLHIPPDDVYEVWDANGHLLGRSANWQGPGNWEGAGNRQDEKREREQRGPAPPWEDISRQTINGHHYRILRIQGSRTVDPGEHGGKVRQVSVIYGAPTARVWESINGAVEFYAAGSLFLLIITGPLIAWLLHRGLLPLRQLAALASQVSVDSWQFSPPASAHSTPELAPLTHALESVLERLQRSFLQQRAFVSDAAHELKTAVAVIKSSLQLLNMKPRSVKEYQAGLERCLTDSLRLEALVADMLALARAESTTPTSDAQPSTDFSSCIQQTVAQLETVAALRNVRILISTTDPDPASTKGRGFAKGTGFSPYIDPAAAAGASLTAKKLDTEGGGGFNPRIGPAESTRALAPEGRSLSTSPEISNFSAAPLAPEEPSAALQVPLTPEDCTLLLSNLILNALQHSPPASTVEINLAIEAEGSTPTAVLVIQDHGDGIPAEALPHVFDRFYRGDPSRTRNTGGTGLGLAIAKAIAQKAGGGINLASQPDPAQPNQGTTATVRLPIAQSPPTEN
jgi:signal transduction histidine kinase